MSKLNILTLNWDGKDKLKQLYPSLISSLQDIDYQWFVKDNNSKDKSVEYLNSHNNDRVKVFAYPNNQQNFSQGCNYLFNEAAPSDNDYVMLLNNDIIFNDTQSIKKMISILDKDPEVGIVGARLLYTGTNKLQHAGVVFDPTYKTPMHFRAGQPTDANAKMNREFQVITGAVCITKAEYFKNACTNNKSGLNGLSENYFWAFDDVDLCLSIKYNMNKKVIYCGETEIFHEESASLKKNPTNRLYLNHNLNHLFSKWGGRYSIDKAVYTANVKHNLYIAPK